MLRFILLSILLTILFRAASRLWSGVVRGMQDGSAQHTRSRAAGAHVTQRGVQMARDPVCGTFVVPERAVAFSLPDGGRLYFCSAECRDKFRAQPQPRPEPVHGRTA